MLGGSLGISASPEDWHPPIAVIIINYIWERVRESGWIAVCIRSPSAEDQGEELGDGQEGVVEQQIGSVGLDVWMNKGVLYLMGSKMSSYLLRLVSYHSLYSLGSRLPLRRYVHSSENLRILWSILSSRVKT